MTPNVVRIKREVDAKALCKLCSIVHESLL